PPYDVISPEEQARLESLSPHNAVRLELPEDAPGQAGSRYARAAATLAEWRSAGVLRTEAHRAYYLAETGVAYARQTLRRRDLLASIGVEPWSAGEVLPHEHTMSGPKEDRLRLMQATHLTASPIWVLYRAPNAAVQAAWSSLASEPPAYDFEWRD